MSRSVAATLAAGIAPAAICSVSVRAWARKPSRGSEWKIFCQLAVMVTTISHAVGRSVTHS